jgi:hypothetical protein
MSTEQKGPIIEHLQEKFFASTLLTLGAGKSSAAADSFSGWILAGFAAVLTFLLGNLDSLGTYLPITTLRNAAYIFVAAIVPAALAKVISVVVVGASEAAALGREVGKSAADQGIDLDLSVALRECEKAFFPPMNQLIKRSLKKMERGDLAASARGLTKWTQVQVMLVLLEVFLITWAAIVLVRGLAI